MELLVGRLITHMAADSRHHQLRFFAHKAGGSSMALPHPESTFVETVSGIARRLHALGVSDGVRVVLLSTDPQWGVAVEVAVLSLGATVVLLSPAAAPAVLAQQIAHSGASALIADDADTWNALMPFDHVLDELWPVLGRAGIDGLLPLHPAEPDVAFLQEQACACRPEQVAFIQYITTSPDAMHRIAWRHEQLSVMLSPLSDAPHINTAQTALLWMSMSALVTRLLAYRLLACGIVVHGVVKPSAWWDALRECTPGIVAPPPGVTASLSGQVQSVQSSAVAAWGCAVTGAHLHMKQTGLRPSRRIRLQHALARRWAGPMLRSALGDSVQWWIVNHTGVPLDGRSILALAGVAVWEDWGIALPVTWKADQQVMSALSVW